MQRMEQLPLEHKAWREDTSRTHSMAGLVLAVNIQVTEINQILRT